MKKLTAIVRALLLIGAAFTGCGKKNEVPEDEEEDYDLEEDDDAEDERGIGKEDYVLCAKCGEIHHESQKVEFSCGHGASSLIRVRRAERKGVRNENKCPCCNLGHMKLFYIGYDVATAVLGTELFEQLPESEE